MVTEKQKGIINGTFVAVMRKVDLGIRSNFD
jgi:hypothetical protein